MIDFVEVGIVAAEFDDLTDLLEREVECSLSQFVNEPSRFRRASGVGLQVVVDCQSQLILLVCVLLQLTYKQTRFRNRLAEGTDKSL